MHRQGEELISRGRARILILPSEVSERSFKYIQFETQFKIRESRVQLDEMLFYLPILKMIKTNAFCKEKFLLSLKKKIKPKCC